MKIIQQLSKQECGVCCLTMLINHYVSEKITKYDVLEKVNLKEEGLSILDLEFAASKFNISLDSYHCEWKEIFEEKPKKPFIIILKIDNFLHYVVATYKNNKIKIYDPMGNVQEYTESSPPNNFYNISIFSDFINQKIEIKSNKKVLLKTFNLKYFFVMLFVSIFLFAINLIVSHICSFLMSIKKFEYLLIAKLIIFFILILITKFLTDLLFQKISNWYFKKTYFLFLLEFKKVLIYKDKNFFSTIEETNILFFYKIIKEYLNYINAFLFNLVKNIIFVIILFILMIQFEWIFFVILVINLINLISNICLNYMNNDFSKFTIKKTNEINSLIMDFCNFNKESFNVDERHNDISKILRDLKKYESKTIKFNWKVFKIQSWFSNLDKLLDVLVFLIIFILNNQVFNAKLILCISLMNLWNGIFDELSSLVISRKSFLIIKDIYNRFISLNNVFIDNDEGEFIEKINQLKINETVISNGTILKIDDFNFSKILESNAVQINNTIANNINTKSVWDNLIISNLENKWTRKSALIDFNRKIDSDLKVDFLNFLENINYHKNGNINTFESLIFNLFNLSCYKNKLIVISLKLELNENSFIKLLADKIIANIMKKNYVLFLNTYQFSKFSNQIYEEEN